ncbi:MAG TPA: hypothetical protein VEC99_08310, partial [Clostridia bacterium]|nr:hypothetical protein [Clostridia bacterium]
MTLKIGAAVSLCAFLLGIMVGRQFSPGAAQNSNSSAVGTGITQFQVHTNSATEIVAPGKQPGLSSAEFLVKYRQVLKETSPRLREMHLYHLSQALMDADIPEVLKYLQQQRGREAMFLTEILLRRWASADPMAAANYAVAFQQLSQKQRLLRPIIEEWVAMDCAAALSWLSGLPPSKEKEQYHKMALEFVAAHDPKGALSLAQSLNLGPASRNRLQATVLEKWAEIDPSQAAALIADLKNMPADAFGKIASEWATRDPKAAMSWAGKLGSTVARMTALSEAAQAWGSVDGPSAAAFLASQPPSNEREMMLTLALHRWVSEEPGAAMSWVANLQDTTNRNMLLPLIAEECAETEPLLAIPYLSSLPSDVQIKLADAGVSALLDQDPSRSLQFAQSLPEGNLQNRTLGS